VLIKIFCSVDVPEPLCGHFWYIMIVTIKITTERDTEQLKAFLGSLFWQPASGLYKEIIHSKHQLVVMI
jgi:hypothetical protein